MFWIEKFKNFLQQSDSIYEVIRLDATFTINFIDFTSAGSLKNNLIILNINHPYSLYEVSQVFLLFSFVVNKDLAFESKFRIRKEHLKLLVSSAFLLFPFTFMHNCLFKNNLISYLLIHFRHRVGLKFILKLPSLV